MSLPTEAYTRRRGTRRATCVEIKFPLTYDDPAATLDDLREAVTTLAETERIARRVLGSAHPTTMSIERGLRSARAALRARETPPSPPPSESV